MLGIMRIIRIVYLGLGVEGSSADLQACYIAAIGWTIWLAKPSMGAEEVKRGIVH